MENGYKCNLCSKNVIKHMVKDKDFIERYNNINKKPIKVTLEYDDGSWGTLSGG